MGVLVFILGRSGTGKSYSMRDFPKDKLAVVNVQGKILPFKGSGKIEMTSTDTSRDIVKALEKYAGDFKSIVVDDFQYVMANEFMRRSSEKGYDKFTEIGRHAWDIANTVRSLPADCIVYVMCHTDRDDEGNEKIKTIGKLLDEKICLEGMSTIVLMTNVTDGVYTFLTQNNGKNTVKSPAGMFPSYAIDNDLHYVDQKIRAYYELGEFLTAEEEAEIDKAAKRDDIPIKDGKKKRRSKAEEPADTAPETAEEKPKRTRKRTSKLTADHDMYMYHDPSDDYFIIKKGEEYDPVQFEKDCVDELTKEEWESRQTKEETEPAEEKPASRRKKKGLVEQQIETAVNDIPEDSDQEAVPFEETKPAELPKRRSRKKAEVAEVDKGTGAIVGDPAPMNPPTATGKQYWKGTDGNILVINAGDPIPNPAEGWTELTKDQYETAIKDMSVTETPEGGRRRRRRRAAE